MPIEEFRPDEFRKHFANATAIDPSRIYIRQVLGGSVNVSLAIYSNSTEETGEAIQQKIVIAVRRNEKFQELYHIVTLAFDFVEELKLPFWLLVVSPVCIAIAVVVTILVVKKRIADGVLNRELYRPAPVEVSVRHGRLYLDGETVTSDADFFSSDVFSAEDEENEVFLAEALKFRDLTKSALGENPFTRKRSAPMPLPLPGRRRAEPHRKLVRKTSVISSAIHSKLSNWLQSSRRQTQSSPSPQASAISTSLNNVHISGSFDFSPSETSLGNRLESTSSGSWYFRQCSGPDRPLRPPSAPRTQYTTSTAGSFRSGQQELQAVASSFDIPTDDGSGDDRSSIRSALSSPRFQPPLEAGATPSPRQSPNTVRAARIVLPFEQGDE